MLWFPVTELTLLLSSHFHNMINSCHWALA